MSNVAYFTSSPAALMRRWQASSATTTTTTTTTSTTTTTTLPIYTVDMYLKLGEDPYNMNKIDYGLYYSVNYGADILGSTLDNFNQDECLFVTTIYVTEGYTFSLGCKNTGGGAIQYNVDANFADCPSNDNIYCGTVNDDGTSNYNYGAITSNISFYVTVFVKDGDFGFC